MKRINLLIVFVFIATLLFTACSNVSKTEIQNTPTSMSETPTLSKATETENKTNDLAEVDKKILNAKKIDDTKSWIVSTTPADNEANVDYSSSISIKFKYDMDENSLNENNIIILEGKHNSIISKLFDFNYNKQTRTLKIDFKVNGNGYGTSNGVMVLLSESIKNTKNEQMGIDVKFGFMTK
jgi:hypothetical protein